MSSFVQNGSVTFCWHSRPDVNCPVMKLSPAIRRVLLSMSLLIVASCADRENKVPSVQDGLFEQEDTLSLGLKRPPGMEKITVYESDGPGYVNNVVLSRFADKWYCMWQESERDEDTPDTHVMYSVSTDGAVWGEPALLAPPTDSTFATPGGWVQRGDSLSAIINYFSSANRSAGGKARYKTTHDGMTWNEAHPVLMEDGSPMQAVLEQDPLLLPSGRTVGAAHFRPGTTLCPVYTDDPSGLRGWRRGNLPEGEGEPMEPSQYVTPGRDLVMLFRDQASSFTKLASVSGDGGETWTAPRRTIIPDSRSKQCAGNLPDGRAFWVGNPTGSKSRRILALALSDDGYLFNKAYLLAGENDLPERRTKGRYKTLGFNYPKAVVVNDTVWVSLSINKEDAVIYRIPVKGLDQR